MNDISVALKTAGVKLPSQMKRIWIYIKDHPNTTRDTLIKALKLPAGGVSSLLAQMTNRKMLSRHKDTYMKKLIWVYRTEMVEYQILPACKVAPRVTKPSPVEFVDVLVDTTKAFPPAVQTLAPKKIDVGDMKLSEARALYLELKEYFGA